MTIGLDDLKFWGNVKLELEAGHRLMLMYVLKSDGSSPGRQGFKMVVSASSILLGSIGGGIMEHKLVELCRKELQNKVFKPYIKRQIHQDNIAVNKSGMICSGEQTIAFYQLDATDLEMATAVLNSILEKKNGILIANEKGLSLIPGNESYKQFELVLAEMEKWNLTEHLGYTNLLHIIGGGHVGLALSKIAALLDFKIKIYDDRTGLNTMKLNHNAECVYVSGYENIANFIKPGPNVYVVLMSFGYRTDKIILERLIEYDYKYLGMMGSKEKVRRLMKELRNASVSPEKLDAVYAPVGIPISSKTPEEIAISILGEIILVKNS